MRTTNNKKKVLIVIMSIALPVLIVILNNRISCAAPPVDSVVYAATDNLQQGNVPDTASRQSIEAVCGDGLCNGSETCSSCPADCGFCQETTGDLLTEGFDDKSFSSRGWFDDTTPTLDTATKYAGAASLKFTWKKGATTPTGFGAMRQSFPSTDTLYASFYWRFNTDWVGSGKAYHPHLLYILSDVDDPWGGLAQNYLNSYIEVTGLVPRTQTQDALNINYDKGSLPNDLTAVTENRDVSGCNGCLSNQDCGTSHDCYDASGSIWANSRVFDATAYPFTRNAWHHVEVYLKMNTITSNVASADGIMQMWVDGTQVMNYSNMLYRTGQHPNLKWNIFVISPYMGDGSPQAQTMWMDELTLSTAKPDGAVCGNGICDGSESCSSCPEDCGSCADTEAPTVPTNLSATAASSSQINLSWTASNDDVGVAGYKIYRNGTLLATSPSPTYQDKGLDPSTTYSYRVSAYDAVGNESAQSNQASATTKRKKR